MEILEMTESAIRMDQRREGKKNFLKQARK
jgi:hypothetical protein